MVSESFMFFTSHVQGLAWAIAFESTSVESSNNRLGGLRVMASRLAESSSSGADSEGGTAGRAVLLPASLRRFRNVTASCRFDFDADRATGLGLPALRVLARPLSPPWTMA